MIVRVPRGAVRVVALLSGQGKLRVAAAGGVTGEPAGEELQELGEFGGVCGVQVHAGHGRLCQFCRLAQVWASR